MLAATNVRLIDESTLLELCSSHDLRVGMATTVGSFIINGSRLLTVAGSGADDSKIQEQLRACIVLGNQRTAVQDIEFLIDQLVEVALRALSPGINDPGTAISCVHRLGQALGKLVIREMGPQCLCDADGTPRVLVHVSPFDHLVDLGFERIHSAASGHPYVLSEIAATLRQVAGIAEDEERENILMEASRRYGGTLNDGDDGSQTTGETH